MDLSFIDVLKVADSNIKLAKDVFKYGKKRLHREHPNESADFMRDLKETLDKFVDSWKKVKKLIMISLREKLFELLPVLSVEEDIMNNIQSHLDEDPYVNWQFAETTEEERVVLASIYRDLNAQCLILDGIYLHVDEYRKNLELYLPLIMFVRKKMADQDGEE